MHAKKIAGNGSSANRQADALVCEHRERALRALAAALSVMSRWSADFYRPGRDGSGKGLVPESVFSAFLGFGLLQLGWTVEREVLQGQGRRDLKATRDGLTVVVETKIWRRNDYKEIQRRLEGAWGPAMSTAVAVVIHDGEAAAFAAGYRSACLSGPALEVREAPAIAPVLRHFHVKSKAEDGLQATCDHLLFRFPGR
jgi:hypothetical protein